MKKRYLFLLVPFRILLAACEEKVIANRWKLVRKKKQSSIWKAKENNWN
ncbi:hypothetical protein [Ornithinibacillus californiensis]|nr:hypothetical protein [Ornithinibacillus californiensis]